jgi:DNA-binding transcriptional LysR family regulator
MAPYRFITVGRLSGNRIILDAALADLPVRPRWFYEVQHLSTSLGLVEAGLGIAAGPQLALPTVEPPCTFRHLPAKAAAPSLSHTDSVP